jgi:hypothetical protein
VSRLIIIGGENATLSCVDLSDFDDGLDPRLTVHDENLRGGMWYSILVEQDGNRKQ